MAKEVDRLNAIGLKHRGPGRHFDGRGLYLAVSEAWARSWVFRWKTGGRAREIGLGSLADVGLAEARKLRDEARKVIAQGSDPLVAKRARRAALAAADQPTKTFGKCADELIKSMAPAWRNPKHHAAWEMTLRVYRAEIRDKPVSAIETEHVLAVLRPIWTTKPETASRLRGRIEAVLDAAKANGHRQGENPARWRGHLNKLLPMRPKLSRGHHKAMPFDQVPVFIGKLRQMEGIGPKGLEFAILTAARSGEVMGATWGEVDLNKKIWTVPAVRMKGAREHRVPLSDRAVAILREREAVRESDFVFPGMRPGRPLSVMAFDMLLRRAELDVTTHGFRSSFRDWCGEVTSFPREVAEAALAHVVGDKAEQAYRRADALDKRRKLMTAWAAYCEPKGAGNVVTLGRASR
jgi:integrase